MRLCYISNSRFPSEKAQSDHVMAMCSAFAKDGNEVTLLVPDRRPVAAEDPFAYYEKSRSFTFMRIPCLDALRWSWLRHAGLWIQTLTLVWNMRARISILKPDVLYSRELYIFLPLFFFKQRKRRCIWESHSMHRSWWAKRLMRGLDGIVTLTRTSKDVLIRFGVEENKIFVEPDAVDPSLFDQKPSREEARQSLSIAENEFLCLYTGKFTTMGMLKGLEESMRAVEILRDEGMMVRLLAIGGTEQELSQFRPLVKEGVTLLGHRPQAELGKYYAAADLLLMPFPWTEHYAYFMSPLKLFEYLMSRVPMIVTDLPSVRDVVSEKQAFFAKPGDVSSLVEQIRAVMDHPKEAKTRAEAAFVLSERFTWEKRAKRILDWMK